jgi:HAD-superfamily hydrolase, subfamily IIB
MIKMLAFDCDGTLLNDSQKIDEETVNAIKKMKDNGIKIVLSSSRPLYRMKKFLKQLDILVEDQYTISFNGGLIIENNDNILFSNHFKTSEVLEIIEMARDSDLCTFIYKEDGIISNREAYEYTSKNTDSIFEVKDLETVDIASLNIYKIILFGEVKDVVDMRKEISSDMYEKYEITSSVARNIEILPRDTIKSTGLKRICKKLGIKSSEIAAFGDNENDLDMLEHVGYSVAMGNATEEVKKCADYVTKSNNDNGIAYAIDKMIKDGIL